MKTDSKALTKTYAVPLDILMDILKIVLKNGFPNRIESINVNQSLILLTVKFPDNYPYRNEAKQNIEILLYDYGYYANGSPDDREFGADPYQNLEDQF